MKGLRNLCRFVVLLLSTAVALSCDAASGVEDPITEVRYLCDPNWGIEIYLGSFANVRKPNTQYRAAVVDWRKTYVFDKSDEKPVFRSAKPLRFDCVVKGKAFSVVFESYGNDRQGDSVDGPGPRPTVTIASGGQTLLEKTVLGICPKGGTEWPRCPDDWCVRAVVWHQANPVVFVQRMTSEFLEDDHGRR